MSVLDHPSIGVMSAGPPVSPCAFGDRDGGLEAAGTAVGPAALEPDFGND